MSEYLMCRFVNVQMVMNKNVNWNNFSLGSFLILSSRMIMRDPDTCDEQMNALNFYILDSILLAISLSSSLRGYEAISLS